MRRRAKSDERWAPKGAFNFREAYRAVHGREFGTQAPEPAPEALPPSTLVDPVLVIPERVPDLDAHAPRKGPEARAIEAITKALKKRGWKVKRRSVSYDPAKQMRIGEVGEPDLEVLPGDGVTVFLEVKRPDGGVVSEAQARWHERHRKLGYVVEVVRTPDEAIAAVGKAIAGKAAR